MKLKYFLPIIILVFFGCRPDREPIRFQMEYFDETFTIDPGFDPILTHTIIYEIPTDYLFFKREFDFEDEDIISITPRRLRISNITTNDDYDFLNEISVRIIDPESPQTPFEIFFHLPNNRNLGNVLDLVPNERDIKSIMMNDRFRIELNLIRFRQRPPTNITSRIELIFDVR